MEAGQRLVERVLEDARVAPGRGGGDRLALVEPHARAGLGEQRRERAADDAAAGDRDVRRAHGGHSAPPGAPGEHEASSSESSRRRRASTRSARRGARRRGRRRGELEHARALALGAGRPSAPRRPRSTARRRAAPATLAAAAAASGVLTPSSASERASSAGASAASASRTGASRASASRRRQRGRLVAAGNGRSARAPPRRRRRAGEQLRATTACRTPRDTGAAGALERARQPGERVRRLVGLDPHRHVERPAARVARLRDHDRLQPRPARGRQRPRDQRRARRARTAAFGAAHPPAAPAGQHGHEGRRGHPPTASGPSSLRSLTCSCSGENGIASRSSAPAAVTSRSAALREVDEQQHLRVARQRVVAQRADSAAARPGPRPRSRGSRGPAAPRGRARPARRRRAASITSTRSPSAIRATARVLASTPAEQHPRAPRGGRRVAHPLDRLADLASGAPTPLTRLSRAAAAARCPSGPAASITPRAALIEVRAGRGSGGRATCRAPWRSRRRARRPAPGAAR